MTAGNDGAPENDDPFGYLYRSEDGQQPDPAAGQPGVPRTSYHQVQRVGERRPAPQPQQGGGYGYPPQQPQTGGYGYPQPGSVPQQPGQGGGGYGYPPQAPYGQPQQGQPQYGGQQPGYDPPQGPPGGRRGGPDGGPDGTKRQGLLIAAVAVVVAVTIGIAFAMTNGSGDNKKPDAQGSTTPATTTAPSSQPTPSASATPFASDKVDAATLTLVGAAQAATQVPGASAAGGTYVAVAAQGDGATWTVTVPEKGAYTLFVDYGNTGGDATLSLVVNGKPRTDSVNMSNWSKTNDPTKAWYTTYSFVDLSKGANTLSLMCAPADTNCAVDLDQVWLKQGQVKK